MEYSTFNACLCMGISAMKTPHCKPDATSRCPICQPEINELADDLPFAHSLNSKYVMNFRRFDAVTVFKIFVLLH